MWRRVSMMVAACALLVGCGGGGDKVDGDVTVFAATSLSGAFVQIGKAFEDEHDGAKVTFNFAASSSLVSHLQSGVAADVLAVADRKTMSAVSKTSVVFAHNRLAIVTKPTNPVHVAGLRDLNRAGVVSLCAPAVPCGAYAADALRRANVTLDESHVSRGPNAASTLLAVTDGDAVAGIVYATDARAAGGRVHVVAIPDTENVIAEYPIAVLANAKHPDAAKAFVAFVRGPRAQQILRRAGFLPA